ncbi:MAG TPA: TolC family protein [Polyangia bacterium]|jgi:outer membrane protein TolC
MRHPAHGSAWRRAAAVGLVLGLAAVARAQAAAPPPAPAEAPPPLSEDRLEATLRAQRGGLRADDVARRAELTSPDVRARQRAVDAARARVDQAVLGFVPRLTGSARYVRQSEIPVPVLGNIVVSPLTGNLANICPPGGPCLAVSAPFQFPLAVDLYTLQAGLQVPVSDYVLRLSQSYAAASHSASAARYNEGATRLAVQRDAKRIFYNWARTRASVVVAEQALATAREHLKDVNAAFHVGTASKADVLRVESQVAGSELLVERAHNLAAVVDEQLRIVLHDPPAARYALGEDLTDGLPPQGAAPLPDLYGEALGRRVELRALDESLAALRASRRLAAAGYYPRLDAVANLYRSNPNPRYFPIIGVWHTTWDVGVQLTWTVNDTLTAPSQVRDALARTAELAAQRAALADGIRMEVMQAYTSLREAEFALATTARQLQAAQESYRVRRDLFRAGRATSAELTDAETDLVRARLDLINARIDARIARISLEHALGRDVPAAGPRAQASSPSR